MNRTKKIILLLVGLVVIYIATLFLPYISAYTKYPIYYVKCGGKPISGSDFKGKTYYVPGDDNYFFSVIRSNYFCSEQEARNAGFEKLKPL